MGQPVSFYIGTYTDGTGSEGIYHGLFDPESGKLQLTSLAARAENPSYLVFHPRLSVLYAVNEVGGRGDREFGSVTAYAVDRGAGGLIALNSQSTLGTSPCYLNVDQSGRILMVANYGSGSVVSMRLADNGALRDVSGVIQHEGHGPNPTRQEGPHVHAVLADRTNRWAYVTDLGLDRVFLYALDHEAHALAAAKGTSVALQPGSGPRHLAFHPTQPILYVVNELHSSVTAMLIDGTGSLTELATVAALPDGFTGTNTAADIHVHPSGRLLLVSNRGHDSVAVFQIASESGVPSLLAHYPSGGQKPRNFALDPQGRFVLVANQASDRIVVYAIDVQTGRLTDTGHSLSVPAPVCIRMSS